MGLSKQKVVALASAISMGAGGMIWLYAEQLDDEHEALVADLLEVVKASRNIGFGQPLTKDRITTEKVPRKFLPPNPLLESELNVYLGSPLATSVEEGAMLLTTDFGVRDAGHAAVTALRSPLVIKTADVTLEAEHPADSGQAALDAVNKAGGYIVASDIYVNRDMQSFTMTARVPARSFEKVVFGFSEIGVTVERRIRGAGVNADVRKLERKLGNQEFVVEGLRNADQKPSTVQEKSIEIITGDHHAQRVERETTTYDAGDAQEKVAAAERELLDTRDELEELQAETALSTIELKITQAVEHAAPMPKQSKSEIIADEFLASGEALLHGLFAAIRLFAKLLPGLILGSPFIIGLAVWYRRRRRLDAPANQPSQSGIGLGARDEVPV